MEIRPSEIVCFFAWFRGSCWHVLRTPGSVCLVTPPCEGLTMWLFWTFLELGNWMLGKEGGGGQEGGYQLQGDIFDLRDALSWWLFSYPSSLAMGRHLATGYQCLLCMLPPQSMLHVPVAQKKLSWCHQLQIYSPDRHNTLLLKKRKRKKGKAWSVRSPLCEQKNKFFTCLSHFSVFSFFLLVVNTPFAVFS